MINVLLVDDHEMILDGLSMLLDSVEDIHVVGTASNGLEAIKQVEKLDVDIVVMDIEMPIMNGIDASVAIKEQFPQVRILVLSMYNDQAFIRRCLEIGVSGYILKNKGREELIEALRDISEGKTFYSRSVMDTLISSIQVASPKKVKKKVHLTQREIDVLKLIALGMSVPQIAEKLFIADSTVITHKRRLLEKTGVPNQKALIVFAYQNGYAE